MLKETIYTPRGVSKGFFPFLKSGFVGLKEGHYLGRQLFIRDIKAQFRDSFLGFFWAFAPAFVTALLWIFLNHSRVISVSVTGMSFPVFAITGTFFWQIITQSITLTMGTINSGKSLLTKLNFPRESLLVQAMYKLLYNIGILLIVTLIILFFMGWRPGVSLLLLPFVIIDLLIFGFSIGLIFLSLFTLVADFSRFISIGLQLLMYISAVVFPVPETGGFGTLIFKLNPFTYLVIFARDILVGMPVENLPLFLGISGVGVILFCIGLMAYKITMPFIIERMGS
ncbi:MAG: ABC transporter permease [Bacteroidota bacterium]|nr:ABC transporter permease [Bacteroidota bacterium]